MRLGEALVTKHLITPAQLKEALEAQLIYGGHLGTCLIEAGHISEDGLGAVLSEMTGVGYAAHELFHDIPRYVTATLPEKLVEKHVAVPFRLRDKILDIAMVDPKNLHALDEISFAAGYKLQPWIAPEVRLYQAMERYYDIPRRLRYITLAKTIDRGARSTGPSATPSGATATATVSAPAASAAAVATPRPAAPRPGPAASSARDAVESRDALEHVAHQLASAATRESLAQVLLEHVSHTLGRCILFKVKDGVASIWRASGASFAPATVAGYSVHVIDEPVFRLAAGEEYYRGALPDVALYRGFYDALGLVVPAEVMVMPVYLDDRLVLMFYGDGGVDGQILGETDDYRRLLRKLGLALSLIMLRRRILAV